jgi:hypothetical protein
VETIGCGHENVHVSGHVCSHVSGRGGRRRGDHGCGYLGVKGSRRSVRAPYRGGNMSAQRASESRSGGRRSYVSAKLSTS